MRISKSGRRKFTRRQYIIAENLHGVIVLKTMVCRTHGEFIKMLKNEKAESIARVVGPQIRITPVALRGPYRYCKTWLADIQECDCV